MSLLMILMVPGLLTVMSLSVLVLRQRINKEW